jgi:hypothetical protein
MKIGTSTMEHNLIVFEKFKPRIEDQVIPLPPNSKQILKQLDVNGCL